MSGYSHEMEYDPYATRWREDEEEERDSMSWYEDLAVTALPVGLGIVGKKLRDRDKDEKGPSFRSYALGNSY